MGTVLVNKSRIFVLGGMESTSSETWPSSRDDTVE